MNNNHVKVSIADSTIAQQRVHVGTVYRMFRYFSLLPRFVWLRRLKIHRSMDDLCKMCDH